LKKNVFLTADNLLTFFTEDRDDSIIGDWWMKDERNVPIPFFSF